MRDPPSQSWLVIATAVVSIVLAIASVEVLLRVAGRGPWRPLRTYPYDPPPDVFHPILGWQSRPGVHEFPGLGRYRIWPDGARATSLTPGEHGPRVIVTGDSFTMGWGVGDQETFSWRLQERYPSVDVRNYGTAGYGTYQSLLRLKLALKSRRDAPTLALYGFTELQELRNVGTLASMYVNAIANRAPVYLPFCLLRADEALEHHAPETYPRWPGATRSAAVNALQHFSAWVRMHGRERQARPVTEQLLKAMHRTARARGAEVFVVLLAAEESRSHWIEVLGERDVPFIDCHERLTPDRIIPGDRHPNAITHGRWTECIAGRVGEWVRGVSAQ